MSTIRMAEESDIPTIDNLYLDLHDNHVSSISHISDVIRSPDYFLVVADEGTRDFPVLVGAATLHLIVQASSGPKGYIDDLVVILRARREGYGRRLFEFLEDIARNCGVAKIFFTCSPRRDPGNKFHIAMGYILRAVAAEENGTNYYEKKLI